MKNENENQSFPKLYYKILNNVKEKSLFPSSPCILQLVQCAPLPPHAWPFQPTRTPASTTRFLVSKNVSKNAHQRKCRRTSVQHRGYCTQGDRYLRGNAKRARFRCSQRLDHQQSGSYIQRGQACHPIR